MVLCRTDDLYRRQRLASSLPRCLRRYVPMRGHSQVYNFHYVLAIGQMDTSRHRCRQARSDRIQKIISYNKSSAVVAPAVEQVPQLYSPAASVTAKRSSEDHLIAFGVGFAVVFGYRRVLPRFCEAGSYIRYASLGGEYNITATMGAISLLLATISR